MSAPLLLVVEDNPTTRKLFRITCEEAGFNVVEAADGRTALELMRQEPLALVIQDLILPDTEGIELTRALRQVPGKADVPIIVVSGFHHLLDKLREVGLAVDAALLKPVEPRRLLETVRSLLPDAKVERAQVGAGRRVLVIDDDAVQLKLSRLRLKAFGFSVSTAANGPNALELAKAAPPDVILSDVLMPNLDGFELCVAVRRDPAIAHVPVVLASAHYDERHDIELAKKVGASALVTRTPNFEAIVDALVAALGQTPPPTTADSPEVFRDEHNARIAQQLRRQTELNAALLERCALQSAQIAVIGGVASALQKTTDIESNLGDVLTACLDAGGITQGALCEQGDAGELVPTHSVGFSDTERQSLVKLLAEPEVRAAWAAGQSLMLGSAALGPRVLRSPEVAGARVAVLAPIDRTTGRGALFLGSTVESVSEQDLLSFGRAISHYIGQAASLVAVFDRLAVVGEVSRVLAMSEELEVTLSTVATLLTKELAHVCEIYVRPSRGDATSVVGTKTGLAKAPMVSELRARYPAALVLDPAMTVLQEGQPILDTQLDEKWPQAVAHDPEHLGLLRALELHSRMVVPICVADTVVGALALGRFARGIAFVDADKALAEDLACRIGVSVDNARLYRELLESNRIKDEFLATVSHELRTPLNAIMSWSQLLQMRGHEPELRARGLAAIERNGTAQAKLIEDVLDVARITNGKLPMNIRPVEVEGVLRGAADVLYPSAAAKGITITIECDAKVGMLSGDPDRLQQVMWNLLSNAVKFTPQNGRINVVAARRASAVEIRVKDTGQGIAQEFLPFVFERFRQADQTTTRTYGGLGLGLALVKHLVEQHGGTVCVESGGVGLGATFIVELPVAAVLAGQAMANPGPAIAGESVFMDRKRLAGMRILVVDDEEDAREALSLLLEDYGAEVFTADSAAAGMKALMQFSPAVILSDLGMPGEDGFSFIASVRAVSTVPALALTGYAGAETARRCKHAGFLKHLTKPVDPERLIAAMTEVAEETAEV